MSAEKQANTRSPVQPEVTPSFPRKNVTPTGSKPGGHPGLVLAGTPAVQGALGSRVRGNDVGRTWRSCGFNTFLSRSRETTHWNGMRPYRCNRLISCLTVSLKSFDTSDAFLIG